MIPSEDDLLESDFHAMHACHSLRLDDISVLSDKDGFKENMEYIPFCMDKDEENFDPMNRNFEVGRGPLPSFHDFNSQELDLDEKLLSPEGSFHL